MNKERVLYINEYNGIKEGLKKHRALLNINYLSRVELMEKNELGDVNNSLFKGGYWVSQEREPGSVLPASNI